MLFAQLCHARPFVYTPAPVSAALRINFAFVNSSPRNIPEQNGGLIYYMEVRPWYNCSTLDSTSRDASLVKLSRQRRCVRDRRWDLFCLTCRSNSPSELFSKLLMCPIRFLIVYLVPAPLWDHVPSKASQSIFADTF